MKLTKKSGTALAAAAATLFVAGIAVAPVQAAEEEGKCIGVNACKGTSACKSATNACKGQNACKGHGWIKATKADCDAQKGTFEKM
jgi:hypothetical protein